MLKAIYPRSSLIPTTIYSRLHTANIESGCVQDRWTDRYIVDQIDSWIDEGERKKEGKRVVWKTIGRVREKKQKEERNRDEEKD